MRLTCPYCGERDRHEFGYRGDAAPQRPALRKPGRNETTLAPDDQVFDYVYMRDNPPGRIRELWQHAEGCRAWLIVERDVTTHAIGTIVPARPLPTGAVPR